MYYFYILKSLKDRELYFGYTNDLQQRFKEHNAGREVSTKERRPLKLIYYEAYAAEEDARNREKQIKRRSKALISLRRRIKHCLAD